MGFGNHPFQQQRFLIGDVIKEGTDAPGITKFHSASEVRTLTGIHRIIGRIHRYNALHTLRHMQRNKMAQATFTSLTIRVKTVEVI